MTSVDNVIALTAIPFGARPKLREEALALLAELLHYPLFFPRTMRAMYIKASVHAGAKKEMFEKVSEDHFNISVKEPAKQNLANRRVCELVARHFKIPVAKVRIVNGHHSPSKLLSVSVE
ncbi:MAG: DUF167 family protein [bacterium]|nr:DUF167 family protein [bacterium]